MKEYIINFWNSLTPLYKIIVLVIITLIVIYLLKKFGDQLSSFFQSRKVNYKDGENAGNQGYTAGGGDPDKGKSFIETVARNIYGDIYDTPTLGHNPFYYEDADSFSDSDLLYLAQYYDKYLTKGVSLFKDMDNEIYFYPSSTVAEKIKARLSQIGVK